MPNYLFFIPFKHTSKINRSPAMLGFTSLLKRKNNSACWRNLFFTFHLGYFDLAKINVLIVNLSLGLPSE
jgi:hypothetical protein